MKSNWLTHLMLLVLSATVAIPDRLAGREQTENKDRKPEHHRYKLVDIGTFGGPESNVILGVNAGPIVNRRGTTVGTSATSVPISPHSHPFVCGGLDGIVPSIFHAFQWRDGEVTDLGALPPAAENCSEAQGVNGRGEIVLQSENGVIDPLTGINEIRGALWKDGKIKELGTFGGNNSLANQINSRGQIAGAASNTMPDAFSIYYSLFLSSPNGTQTRAFLWEDGHMQDLGTLGGPDAVATFVNERGQVAGTSYTNSTPNPGTNVPTLDPFLWTKEKGMIDLGTLGGTSGGPNALNNRGQVIGSSNLVGDQASDAFLWDDGKLIDLTAQSGGAIFSANAINDAGEIVGGACFPNGACDAYLWKDGVVTDLGTLAGDCFSQAFAINSRVQIVGQSFSCVTNRTRTFLWDKGAMTDLNAFVPPSSGLQLVDAQAINDGGVIAGDLLPPSCIGTPQGQDNQCGHAFVLVPCEEDEEDSNGCIGDDNAEGNGTTQSGTASVSQAQTTAHRVNLTPSEIKDRVRAFVANRNRRF